MGRGIALAVASLVVVLLAALPGAAGVASAGEKSDVYVVVLSERPVVAYTGGTAGFAATKPARGNKVDPDAANVRRYVAHLDATHASVLERAGAARSAKFYDYSFAVNGFAAELTPRQVAAIQRMPEVVLVQHDIRYHTTTDNSPTFLGLQSSSGKPAGLWAAAGGPRKAGEDVIVGVVDTGIWPEHPSFSDQADLADRPGSSGDRLRVYGPPPADWHGTCQTGEQWSQDDCNNKLIGARYFLAGFTRNGIAIGAAGPEYASARDHEGHGTHTSSTAAGNYGVTAQIFGRSLYADRPTVVSGMAPRARVAMYKALWGGSGFSSDLGAAIDAAVHDGVDVINYSIGSDTPSIIGFDSIAFLFSADAGIFSSVSAGNAGPGAGTVGSPASVPWVSTAGASTQDRTFEGSVVLGNGDEFTGASVTPGTDGALPLVDSANAGNGDGSDEDKEEAELCFLGELDPAKIAGNVVLCKRGTNDRIEKSRAVKAAGGLGMVLYNPNDVQALVTDNHWVPSVHINFTDGSAIKTYIADTANPTATIVAGVAKPGQGSAMADFSSRGPDLAEQDFLKPDVTAPGVNVLAGNTPTANGAPPGELFQSISGTSMAAPHVAGIAALLKQLHPAWDAEHIKSALMTTGRQDVVKEDGSTPADPFDFGGGHIVPAAANDPGLVFDEGTEGYTRYLCGVDPALTSAFFAVLYNRDAECSQHPTFAPNDLNLPSIAISQVAGDATVTRTVTNVGGSSATYRVTSSISGFDVDVVPSRFTIPAGGTQALTITVTRDRAAVDEWSFGALRLTDRAHTVRVPLALRPVLIQAPVQETEDATADSGDLQWDVKVGYSGRLSADGFGLAADDVKAGEEVAQDPDQDIGTDPFTVGVKTYDYTLDGAQYFAAGTRAATTEAGSDIDVYLYYDAENNGFTDDELVAFSADGDSEEIVELVNPADGKYRLVVHGWGTPDGATTYDLHQWLVDQTGADTGSLVATAGSGDPFAVTQSDTVQITASYSGLTAPGQYRGVVNYDDGSGTIGSTVVLVDR
jgi:subtilisin family serine protease